MPYPAVSANTVVLWGRWYGHLTRAGLNAEIVATPKFAQGQTGDRFPNLVDVVDQAEIKTGAWKTLPLQSGLWALPLLSNNDAQLGAFGGWEIAAGKEPTFLIEILENTPTIVATQEMVDALSSACTATGAAMHTVAVNDLIQAVWVRDAAVLTSPAVAPPVGVLTSAQVVDLIAGVRQLPFGGAPGQHPTPKVGGGYEWKTPVAGGTTASDATTTDKGVARVAAGTADDPQMPWGKVTGKPAFAPVATTGTYGDLSGRPTIPATYAELSGQVPQSALPAIALHDFLGEVATQSAMLALVGQRGDWCIRTDKGSEWQLVAEPSSTLASWKERIYPASPVSSVNGRQGPVTGLAEQTTVDGKADKLTQRTIAVTAASPAGDKTAAANEIVPLDTTVGTFTLTGPTGGGIFGARWRAGTVAPTIAAPSGHTIAGAASITMGLAPYTSSGELVIWQPVGTDYQPVGGFKPHTALTAASDARYVMSRALLARLHAGLASRQQMPCRVAFVGSSTTQGVGASDAAHRYVDALVKRMQTLFPSAGTETTVVASTSAAFGTLSTAGGVHGYNAGEGGTTSATYLTDAECDAIAALDPRMVLHMVGSNDIAANTDPAMYRANIASRVARIKAAVPNPLVQFVVHSYPRMDLGATAYPWSAYGQALRDLAAADPDNVLFVDLASPYAQVGVPTGLTRQVSAGSVVAKDSLRRAASALGNTDTGQVWTPDGTWSLSSSGAACSAGSGLAYIDAGTGEMDVTVTVAITSGSGAVGLLLNAQDFQNRLVFFLNAGSGSWALGKFDGSSAIVTLASGTGITTGAGTTHVLRAASLGATITLYVDGTQVGTYTLTTAEQAKFKAFTKAGLRQNPAMSGTLADFSVSATATGSVAVVDPLNLVGADNAHQTDAGHAFMATQLSRELGVLA